MNDYKTANNFEKEFLNLNMYKEENNILKQKEIESLILPYIQTKNQYIILFDKANSIISQSIIKVTLVTETR
jgi:alpha-galactosidase